VSHSGVAGSRIISPPGVPVLAIAASLSARSGGATSAALGLHEALIGQGSRCQLWGSDAYMEPHQSARLASIPNVRIFRCSRPRPLELSWGLLLELVRHLWRTRRHDGVIILHGAWLAQTLLAAQICARSRKRLFLIPHGSLESYEFAQKRWLKRLVGGWLLRSLPASIAVIATAQAEVDGIKVRLPRRAVHVLPLGLADSWLSTRTRPPQSGRPFVVGHVGRFADKKRLDVLLSAAVLAAERGSNDLVLIFGGAPDDKIAPKLVARSAEAPARLSVRFLGEVTEMLTATYDHLDLFCLPSENENFALAVAEALCRGVPVVITRQVALHELVDSAGCGVVLDAPDVAGLAAAIERFAGDRRYWTACSERAHAAARRHLIWSSVIPQWIGVLFGQASVAS
jgi:glycosyltransferase involved in cell wall biosynthesis